MQRYLTNSLLVVAAAVPITLLFSSLAGFGLSQLPNPLRTQLLQLTIALLLIPSAAVWLFRYQILNWLGLIDSLWALILPSFAASNPLFVLLFYWAFRRVPTDMYDAARLDAAGAWTIWSQLAMPLVHPTSVGVIVLTFIMYWSDFVGPVLYIFNPQHYTLPVGMQLINQLGSQNYALIMAAAVFITGPVLIMFFFLQRFFLTDLSLANLFEKN
jgi:multiple sugar transport system permease protein